LWLHSLKVAQLLRSAACLHTNQSRSYLNHLVVFFQNGRRAMTKSSAGHLWPAGHALKTPELEHDGIEKDSGEASFVNCAQ